MGPYWWPIFSDLKKLEEKNVKVIITTSRCGGGSVLFITSKKLVYGYCGCNKKLIEYLIDYYILINKQLHL